MYPTSTRGILRHVPRVSTRISVREPHPPKWLKDFVSLNINKDVKYPIYEYISYYHLSHSYQAFIVATSALVEPTTYAEANKDPRWVKAMQVEIQALERNNTWELYELPKGKMLLVGDGFTESNMNPRVKLTGSKQGL